jgi:hypothetical protein
MPTEALLASVRRLSAELPKHDPAQDRKAGDQRYDTDRDPEAGVVERAAGPGLVRDEEQPDSAQPGQQTRQSNATVPSAGERNREQCHQEGERQGQHACQDDRYSQQDSDKPQECAIRFATSSAGDRRHVRFVKQGTRTCFMGRVRDL